MPKSAPSRSTKQSGPPSAGKQASSKKLVYAAALKDRNRKITQEVQAALRSAHAGELLFRKA